MCQHHRQHDRARRQRAEAAPRAEGLANAPQRESTTQTPYTHPHNNPRLVRTAGDVPLPAFRQHTDAQAAHGCGRADRRRVSGGTQGRRGGESAPRPHHRVVYTQVFACSAARSVCAMYLAAGAASDCGGGGSGCGAAAAVAGGTPDFQHGLRLSYCSLPFFCFVLDQHSCALIMDGEFSQLHGGPIRGLLGLQPRNLQPVKP
jgi:hypothetical protein